MYINTYVYVHIYIYICKCTYIFIYTCIHIQMYIFIDTYIHIEPVRYVPCGSLQYEGKWSIASGFIVVSRRSTAHLRQGGKGSDQWVRRCTVRQLEIYRLRKTLGCDRVEDSKAWAFHQETGGKIRKTYPQYGN